MAVNKYRRTLTVTAPSIELAPGVHLPNGTYPVVDEQIIVSYMGQKTETPGRLVLSLTREQLISFGVDMSQTSVLGVDGDIRSDMGKPGLMLS